MSERDPFDLIGIENNIVDATKDLKKAVASVYRQNVRAGTLSEIAQDGGDLGNTVYGESYMAEDGIHTSANLVDVNWWLPLNLSDDNITYIFAFAYDGSEYVYAGGSFDKIGGVSANFIARYSLINRNWESIGGQLNQVVSALAINGDDLYVGGMFTNADGIATADYIAKYSITGGTWSSIGGQLGAQVTSLVVEGDDLFVGGKFTNADGVATADYIAKYSISGGTWASIGGQLNGNVYALLVNDGVLYVGGNFVDADAIATADYIAKYSISGGTWSSMGGQLNQSVYALAVYNDSLFVGGKFTSADAISGADYIAKYSISGGTWANMNGELNDAVHSLTVSQDNLYIGGKFTGAGGSTGADRIAIYKDGVWGALSNAGGAVGLDGIVYAILAFDFGSVIAGGSFNFVGAIKCQSVAVYCKPLSEAIDVVASLFELYASRTAITHDSAVFAALTVNSIDMIPAAGTFTPSIVGVTTPGAGTYTTRLGEYFRIGNLVYFEVELIWTAHTGTGNMRVSGLPFTAKNNGIDTPLAVAFSNITLGAVGNKVQALVLVNTKQIALQEVGGGAASNLAIDTAATVRVSGCYLRA